VDAFVVGADPGVGLRVMSCEWLDLLRGVQGKVILSGYASELYDRTLADWNREEVEQPNHAAGGRGKRRMVEVLWMNY
jgi:DNA adenine methylase